jgi:hypothetical protein
MPQLILIAAVGAGAYAGYRWLKKASEELRAATVEARDRRTAVQAKDLGALELDPKSGVYRPVDRS